MKALGFLLFFLPLTLCQASPPSPQQYLMGKFIDHDVILLAEDHAIRDNLEFVMELIPELYQAGIYNLAMEFGASENQHVLDSLLNAPEYDASLARDIMFFYNVGWAYREYTDIYHEVWKLNSRIPAGAPRFRIINMSYRYDWSGYHGEVRTPENMRKVFHKGPPDMYRANIIEKEVIDKGQKVLVLTGTVHAFTKYKVPEFSATSDDFCDYDDRMLGHRLYKKYPEKVATIILHQPFPAKPNSDSWLLNPAGGALEEKIKEAGNQPMGFDLDDAFWNLPDSSMYSTCYPGFTLGQLADGYIFLKPLEALTGSTVDPLFFEGRNWEDIKEQLPDPDWRGDVQSLEEFIRQIEAYVNLKMRYGEVK